MYNRCFHMHWLKFKIFSVYPRSISKPQSSPQATKNNIGEDELGDWDWHIYCRYLHVCSIVSDSLWLCGWTVACQATVHGIAKSRHNWATSLSLYFLSVGWEVRKRIKKASWRRCCLSWFLRDQYEQISLKRGEKEIESTNNKTAHEYEQTWRGWKEVTWY